VDDVPKQDNLRQPAIRVRGKPFAKGNSGRRPGSKNRATLVAQALLEGEAHKLLRKGLEVANAGDTQMLRFFLDRTLPKDRPLEIDSFLSPSDGDGDPVEASQKVFAAAVCGQITPSEASALMAILEGHARIMQLVEFGERLEQIEKTLRNLQRLNPGEPR
jgi:hypothetical protein